MPRTLVVTNDFPPRPGGIQTFVQELLVRQPADSVVVYASSWRGAEELDRTLPFPVVRYPHRVMLPVPPVANEAVRLLTEHDCTSVLFGAAAPLGLLAGRLRGAGAQRLVALTHGHEAGWAGIPGASSLLRRAVEGLDATTYLGRYTHDRIVGALSPAAASRLVQLAPGVDATVFRPDVDGSVVRDRYDLAGRPVVVCVSRLMPRKGQDTLIEAWPSVQAQVPGAALLLVGGGPLAGAAGQAGRRSRASRRRDPHRLGAVGRAPRPLRRRRRLRHAVPHPQPRARRGGPGHRLPGGLRHRPPRGGR